MTEVIHEPSRTPGIVIFVSILNFVMAGFFMLLAIISVSAVIFGNIAGVYDYVSTQIAQHAPNPNFSYGITFIFSLSFGISLFFLVFLIFLGTGLIRGRRWAWYTQIVLSVLNLTLFPIGTVFSVIILLSFFHHHVRDFFKV